MKPKEPSRGGDPFGRNLTFGLLDALGRAIVTGEYDEARFPTEAELAAEHGVSRSVTREAVKMLAMELIFEAVEAMIAAISAAKTRPSRPGGSSRIIVG